MVDGCDPETPEIEINWGKFGDYVMTIAKDGQSMTGSAKNDKSNWRKATRLRELGAVAEAHVHDH